MSEHTNIAVYTITNNEAGLDICYSLEDDLLLYSESERENRSTNEGKNNDLLEEKHITTDTNLQLKTSDLPTIIDLNLDYILAGSNIIVIHSTTHREEPQKVKLNKN